MMAASERDAPRFLRLLGLRPLIEVRRTSPQLRQLTDSFCIADQRDIVRRFHADHFRGEAYLTGRKTCKPAWNVSLQFG
jgi:hypothetical protein